MAVKFEGGSHWYQCRDAEPKAQHNADLRVARREFLYPSITTVLKDEKNEFLEIWRTKQLLLAAANFQKQPHDTEESYCQRIYDISNEKATTAADFGKRIHDAIEKYPDRSGVEVALLPWVERFGSWYDTCVASVRERETILFDHDIGLAGRCDFIGEGRGLFEGQTILPDWKSQDVKKDEKGRKKPAFYDSWPKQLAFYAVSYAKQRGLFPLAIPRCVSVIIDSNEPDTPFVKVWDEEEIKSAYEDVVIMAYKWFKKRKYWPMPVPFKVGFTVPMP